MLLFSAVAAVLELWVVQEVTVEQYWTLHILLKSDSSYHWPSKGMRGKTNVKLPKGSVLKATCLSGNTDGHQ